MNIQIDFSIGKNGIDTSTFINLNVLGKLDLSNNQIKHLHDNTFKELKNLKVLLLRRNKIEFFEPSIFVITIWKQLNLMHSMVSKILRC